MGRSTKKGPFIDEKLMKKVQTQKAGGVKTRSKLGPDVHKSRRSLWGTHFWSTKGKIL